MRSQSQAQPDDDEDEDEETLQLQLQALEAKLKLKRLQKRSRGNSSDAENGNTHAPVPQSQTNTSTATHRDDRGGLLRSKSAGNIQVPLSPERKPVTIQEQRSPGRVLLGIDKGLSARNVSLRRAPSSLAASSSKDDPFGAPIRPSASRTESRATSRMASTVPPRANRDGLKSFNERIAETRLHEQGEQERQQRAARLRAQKSTGFGVREDQIEAFKAASEKETARLQREESVRTADGYSRADVVNVFSKPPGGMVKRANSMLDRSTKRSRSPTKDVQHHEPTLLSRTTSLRKKPSSTGSISLSDESRPSTPGDPGLFEGFSHTNLSRRILPHSFLARTLEDKTPATIPSLLRQVIAPDFSLPQEMEENDFVVFGIIASKSAPLNHKEKYKSQAEKATVRTSGEEAAETEANVNGKYMIFTLTDLKWTLDLYVFTTAYVRFRKLQPGTLIAILNPSIMPPPPGRVDTNRWSLTLHSSDDTILEIGTSKDLGWCKATKKDGNPCNAWVDSRKNDFCEFHVDRNIEQARRGRMEVNGMSAPFAPGGKGAGRHGFFGSGRRQKQDSGTRDDGLLKEGRQYDRTSRSTYYMTPHLANRSAANLLDADEDGGIHGSREERVRKALAGQEKEREIARKLGEGGNGTGAEYLRLRHGSSATTSTKQTSTEVTVSRAPDANDLGLRDNRAGGVMLGPLKRKHSSAKRGLNGNGGEDGGPQKKKTRFVTAKGIREAGRESLTVDAIGRGDIDLDGL